MKPRKLESQRSPLKLVRRLRRMGRRRPSIVRRRDVRLGEPSSMDFGNATTLSTDHLRDLFLHGMNGWSVGAIRVRVRYTRSTAFSGTCIYVDRHIYVNLGRHLRYPYQMKTNLARVQTIGSGWRRELYRLEMKDAYQLALFIFMHELYHLLVYRAGRNTRQKESMCDRFAARHLLDHFGCAIRDAHGRPVPRDAWDFQDLDGFVAAVRIRPAGNGAVVRKAARSSR